MKASRSVLEEYRGNGNTIVICIKYYDRQDNVIGVEEKVFDKYILDALPKSCKAIDIWIELTNEKYGIYPVITRW